jgi:hypothetical protein
MTRPRVIYEAARKRIESAAGASAARRGAARRDVRLEQPSRPEEALDSASGHYVADPSVWLTRRRMDLRTYGLDH